VSDAKLILSATGDDDEFSDAAAVGGWNVRAGSGL